MSALRIAAALLAPALAWAAEPADLFEMRVRPLLVNKCFTCHTDAKMGGLQLDSREHMLTGGKSGPVLVPGDADKSRIAQAIRYTDPRLKMPPGGKLPDEDIRAVETWIQTGAVWPENLKPVAAKPAEYKITAEQRAFWSFQPIADPPAPAPKNKKWPRNEIDRFILVKLEQRGLEPVRSADRRTLIRRATFDLTGLPPTAEEVDAFEKDRSPNAFAKVVDRLLASPRYGERWGRYWLDVARYSDDRLNSTQEDPYANAFRYRDWVIQAFQNDMPFDLFIKAQIAGDLLPEHEKYEAGLGFYALSPEFQDDRVDATTRGFLGLTVACATCHNHKFDPIPAKDYYSLLGIFQNTKLDEYPLAPKDVVDRYQAKKKEVDAQKKAIDEFLNSQSQQLAEILATRTAQYMLAVAETKPGKLDQETYERWTKYLKDNDKRHPYLKPWFAARERNAGTPELEKIASGFQVQILEFNQEKKLVDDKNHIILGLNPDREALSSANLVALERDKYVVWEDVFGPHGVLYYGDKQIDRFLSGEWKRHLDEMRAQLETLKKELPTQYAYLHTIKDVEKPVEQHVWIRGNKDAPGELAPPRFLHILSPVEPPLFDRKHPRLDLADAIASASNPLTARVIVNRVWAHHFGEGLVRTPSNFGAQGDRPANPELLDFLAHRFIQNGWSIKKLHREIMLSAEYALSAENSDKNFAVDPDNRLCWRFNRRRLDIEGLRDSLLYSSGKLDLKEGGEPVKFGEANDRRTVYGYVNRIKLDTVQVLFEFPNPNSTSEQRMRTNVPLQRLFFMNSEFVTAQAKALADRVCKEAPADPARVRAAYRLLFQRDPLPEEQQLALEFLTANQAAWPRYAQILLSSNEFEFVN